LSAGVQAQQELRSRLLELAALFTRLGFTAFGGPAAHIAMMEEEVVRRRGWLTREEFLDLLAATNLIPGPNSTEMAIHVGRHRAGLPGLIVAGACFIVPATLIVLLCAVLYVRYGTVPQARWLLYGVSPVIIAIVVQALWSLFRSALKDLPTRAAGIGVAALSLAGIGEIPLLALAGLGVMAAKNVRWRAAAAVEPVTLTAVFLFFLKVGSVLYGSGYVLLAFLEGDLVERWEWLTAQQLLDAIAVGQFTPGPVFTTATFVGYLVGGLPGSLVATVGIFLPAFVFVAALNPLIPLLRRSRWAGAFLDGVVAASLALMAVVTWKLGAAALVDLITVVLAALSLAILVRYRINSAWLVGAGAALGYLAHLAGLA
jgi:chromate transporter